MRECGCAKWRCVLVRVFFVVFARFLLKTPSFFLVVACVISSVLLYIFSNATASFVV